MRAALVLLLLAGASALTAPVVVRPRHRSAAASTPALPRRAVGRATSPPLLTAAANSPEAAKKKPLATLLGWGMAAGSLGVFLPIILRILSDGTAAGFSKLTWGMQLVGYSAFMVYPIRCGYSASTYCEYVCLLAQVKKGRTAGGIVVCTYAHIDIDIDR